MKKKITNSTTFLLLTVLTLVLSSFFSTAAFAEEEVEYDPSKPSPYDVEAIIVDPEDYQKSGEFSAMAGSTYVFWETNFSSYIWIKSGNSFYNPNSIGFESVYKNGINLEAYTSSGAYQGKCVSPKISGWRVCPWEHLPRGKSYKFKFVNTGPGSAKLKSGSVEYNW